MKSRRIEVEEELQKMKQLCKKYDYKAYLNGYEIHIKTKFEEWYFVPSCGPTNKIYHKNFVTRTRRRSYHAGYHSQFDHNVDMTYEEMIEYFHNHEIRKFLSKETKI